MQGPQTQHGIRSCRDAHQRCNLSGNASPWQRHGLSVLLNQYLSEMTAIAERHGATIDKFVGDAIMVFFGAPSATSDRDHALRAVRMAIEMQERLVALRDGWLAEGVERPFHVRMGINTGHASIGAFGSGSRLEYTAIGRQVNLAARLQAVRAGSHPLEPLDLGARARGHHLPTQGRSEPEGLSRAREGVRSCAIECCESAEASTRSPCNSSRIVKPIAWGTTPSSASVTLLNGVRVPAC